MMGLLLLLVVILKACGTLAYKYHIDNINVQHGIFVTSCITTISLLVIFSLRDISIWQMSQQSLLIGLIVGGLASTNQLLLVWYYVQPKRDAMFQSIVDTSEPIIALGLFFGYAALVPVIVAQYPNFSQVGEQILQKTQNIHWIQIICVLVVVMGIIGYAHTTIITHKQQKTNTAQNKNKIRVAIFLFVLLFLTVLLRAITTVIYKYHIDPQKVQPDHVIFVSSLMITIVLLIRNIILDALIHKQFFLFNMDNKSILFGGVTALFPIVGSLLLGYYYNRKEADALLESIIEIGEPIIALFLFFTYAKLTPLISAFIPSFSPIGEKIRSDTKAITKQQILCIVLVVCAIFVYIRFSR